MFDFSNIQKQRQPQTLNSNISNSLAHAIEQDQWSTQFLKFANKYNITSTNYISVNQSHNVLYVCNFFGIFKLINKGSQGFTNPYIIEFRGFGPSHNKTEILLDQNRSE